MVVLGAGLDTRACRLAAPSGIPSFEVDLPVNIARKQRRMRLPDTVATIPIDFETDNLADGLTEHGYRPDTKTIFIWEGVTQYLSEDAVRATFELLATAAAGSKLVFSYVRKDFLDGTNRYGAEASYRRFVAKGPLWRFGLAPEAIPTFLAEYGWRELEQVGAAEFTERYLEPIGRRTAISGLERCVYAEKI